VERRDQVIRGFFGGAELDPESNIQFGEGGAGTYSTESDDPGAGQNGRNRRS
jgi:uncharacterized FAD-dependent dehydrogenase